MIDVLLEALAEGPPDPTGLLVSPEVWRQAWAHHAAGGYLDVDPGRQRNELSGVPVTVKAEWDGDRFEVVSVRIPEDLALRCELEEVPMRQEWRIRFPELRVAENPGDLGSWTGEDVGPSYLTIHLVPSFTYTASMPEMMVLSLSELEAIRRQHLDEARRQRIASLEAEGFEVTPSISPRIQQFSRTVAAMTEPMVSGPVRQLVGQAVDAFIEQQEGELNREALEWGGTYTSWLRTEDGRLEPSGHSLPFGSGVPRHVSCRSITGECAQSVGTALNESLSHAVDAMQYAMQYAFEIFPKTSKAEKRAKALLFRYLTPEQARTYRATGSFLVQGSQGTVYRINSQRSINVETVRGPCPSEARVGSLPGRWLAEAGGLRVNGRPLRSKRRRICRKIAKRSAPVRCCLGGEHTGGHLWRPDGDGIDWESVPETRDRHFCLEMPGCPLPDQLLAQKLFLEDDEDDFIDRSQEWDPETMLPIRDFDDAHEEERRARQARVETLEREIATLEQEAESYREEVHRYAVVRPPSHWIRLEPTT